MIAAVACFVAALAMPSAILWADYRAAKAARLLAAYEAWRADR